MYSIYVAYSLVIYMYIYTYDTYDTHGIHDIHTYIYIYIYIQ